MKSKLLLTLVLSFTLLISFTTVSAQTVHQVEAGDGTLAAAVAAAASGDIIELITNGGLYTHSENDKIFIDKVLTIRASEWLDQKPVIRSINVSSTSARIFEIAKDTTSGGNSGLTLQGLDLDGRSEDGGSAFAKNLIRSSDIVEADSFHYILKIEDCILHDVTEQMIKFHQFTIADSVIINNCIFTGAGREAIYNRETTDQAGTLYYMEVNNCTFSKIAREAFYFQYTDPVFLINHCTFDSVGLDGTDRIIYPNGLTEVHIKNSIFSNQGAYTESIKLYGNSTISFSDTFKVSPVILRDASSIGAGMLNADPEYTDPANGDFTLMSTSELLGMADDGFAMGDLRWDISAQGPKVHRVYAGENTLYDAVQAAASGDILELMDNGGVYVYTASSDKIEVDKVLTIRAREGLTQKPIIRNDRIGSTSNSTRHFDVISGGSLTLIGLEFDGSRYGDGVPYSKQAIRLAAGDSSSMFLKIYDCYFHDYTENFFRGYIGTVVDTIIVQNSVFNNSVREGLLLYDTSSDGPAVNYCLYENITISKVGREAVKFGSNAVGYNPEVIINHITVDSSSLDGNYRVLRFDGASTGINVTNATITNCILTNQMGTYEQSIRLYGTSTISYSDTFNVRPVGLYEAAVLGDSIIDADPLYKDPSMGDYRLATNSPVRGAANDGKAMGDLRWEADPGQFILQVLTEGGGIVTVDPAGPFYDPATTVNLTAVPDPNWKFDSWVGVSVFPPNNPQATVTMDDNKTVTAKFVDIKPTFSFTVSTVGIGHVDLSPAPVDGMYKQGTNVTLTAVPDSNTWAFVEWGGSLSGSENPATVMIDSAMDITATFASTLTQFTLTLDIVGKGSVMADPEPILGTYDTATVVILNAEAALGWEFAGWGAPLNSMMSPDTIQMDSNITLTVNFAEMSFSGGAMEIDTTWDLRDAIEFANNNSYIDTLVLVTSGGLYKTVSNSDVVVTEPLTIMAKAGLEEKPVLINAAEDKNSDDILRVFNDLTLKGVILEGEHAMSHGPKYGIRLRHFSADSVKQGTNITVTDCDFINFHENKSATADGHAFKIDTGIKAGDVLFENCFFMNTGYEALRISDTENWVTDGPLASLTVRNCTFTNIDAECIRYYSDLDAATPDAPVLLEHITINNSATRVFYLKNSGGAIARDIIVSNSRTSGHGRDSDIMDVQGNTDAPSFVSHIDTFNVSQVPIKSTDGEIDTLTIYGIDPMYTDAENFDYTVMNYQAYGQVVSDGTVLGDQRWSDETVSDVTDLEAIVPLRYNLEQNYPNPFNPSTKIKFAIKESGLTTLKVYDVLGREVAELVNKEMTAGEYEVEFYNTRLATGLYFYQIKSGNFLATKKMLMIK